MEAVQIGPFYLNWSLAAFLLSAAAGYIAIGMIIRRTEWKPSGIMDLLFNALVIGIFVWKLAPFLFQPSSLWRAPLKVIMTQGGGLETTIGIGIAAAYLLVQTYRRGLPLKLLTDTFAYGTAVFIAVRGLLGGWRYGKPTELPWGIALHDPAFAYHPVNAYESLAGVILAVIYWLWRMKPGDGRAGRTFLLYGGVLLFAVSLFDADGAVSFIFTGRQWSCILLTGIGLLLPRLHILWEACLERRNKRMTNNDSKAQQEHERKNKQDAKQTAAAEASGSFDKKLDGPNRPAD